MNRPKAGKSWGSVVILVGLTVFLAQCGNTPATRLPKSLAGLILTKVQTGPEAARVINQMHGKSLGTETYEIGYYGPEADKDILYLSIYPGEAGAKSDNMSMSMKLANGTAVFTPLKFDHMDRQARFRTTGMGKSHIFYREKNILIWLQMDSTLIDSGIADLERFEF